MTDDGDSAALAEMRDRIGEEQYHEVGEFPVERSYVWTSCASVENGNPLYWDDAVADAVDRTAPWRRRPWSRSGSGPTTGRRGGRRRRCRCRSTSI